jgi:hypothetical protein
MSRCITATVSTASILRWVKLRTMGSGHSLLLVWCFCWRWSWAGTLFRTLCACVWFELNASATFIWTWFVITMFKLWCILWCELLCNLWWWPLNLLRSWLVCELVWNPSWFHGLLGYMGLSLLNHSPIEWFSYLISYNWAVLLQLVSKHGLACLLFISVFKTKLYLKSVISKLKVCQWSYPLCPVKDSRWLN